MYNVFRKVGMFMNIYKQIYNQIKKYNKSNNKVYKVKFYFYTEEYESKKIIFEINGNIYYLDKDDIETNKE